MDFLSLLIPPLVAAVLVLLGNAAFLRFQTRAKVREELRAFVRELHFETVDWVVDLDLLLRELRSLMFSAETAEDQIHLSRTAKDRWEGDLVRRTRKMKYGHPDPDIRVAADRLEDAFVPLVVGARTTDDQREKLGWRLLSRADRDELFDPAEIALESVRKAVWEAPRRDVPKGPYDGSTNSSDNARERNRARAQIGRLNY